KWDSSLEIDLGNEMIDIKENGQIVKFSVAGKGQFSKKNISISVGAGITGTVYEIFEPTASLSAATDIFMGDGASLKLVQIYKSETDAAVIERVTAKCPEGSRLETVKLVLGRGDTYTDTNVTLEGCKSSYKADIGYFAAGTQRLDFNVAVDHFGKDTESEINAAGALKDAASKVFRGTIDFKTGSAGSVGNEHETVLMLGDNVINKTVPLILCAEENVVGNHGATIGELDDDTLFYFESRGIDRETAENILAKASVERVARSLDDKELSESIMGELNSLF
ncbi:MAG: SufB/SufD family protein, partial [Acutalibacteraceae bacterium]